MLPFPQDKKFSIIYADPPWPYESKTNLSTNGEYVSHISDEYSVMSFDDIYNLPIQDISDDDCLLFLWVVSPSLLEGIEKQERGGDSNISLLVLFGIKFMFFLEIILCLSVRCV